MSLPQPPGDQPSDESVPPPHGTPPPGGASTPPPSPPPTSGAPGGGWSHADAPGGWDAGGQSTGQNPPGPNAGGYQASYRQPMTASEERSWAMGAHLSALIMVVGIPSLLGPLLVWLVKREQSAFVDDQGKEALNFNLSVFLYAIVGGILMTVLAIITLGVGLLVLVPLGLLLAAAWFVLVIVAAVRANAGETYRYPLTIRFLR